MNNSKFPPTEITEPGVNAKIVFIGNREIETRRYLANLDAKLEAGREAMRAEINGQLTTPPPKREPRWKRWLYARLWK